MKPALIRPHRNSFYTLIGSFCNKKNHQHWLVDICASDCVSWKLQRKLDVSFWQNWCRQEELNEGGNVCIPGATPGGSQRLLRRLYSRFLPLVQQCCMAGTNGYGCVMTSLFVPKVINYEWPLWLLIALQAASCYHPQHPLTTYYYSILYVMSVEQQLKRQHILRFCCHMTLTCLWFCTCPNEVKWIRGQLQRPSHHLVTPVQDGYSLPGWWKPSFDCFGC